MNLEQLCTEAIRIIKETGQFIREENKKLQNKDIQTKGLHNYVTYVDKTAEQQLVTALSRLIPSCGFITEEDTISQRQAEYTWIIDPLDGTTNYIHRIPVYSVSVALQHNGQTVLGIVYEVSRDECFYARGDSPLFLNGYPSSVSNAESLDSSLLATGFPYYDYSRLQEYMAIFIKLLQQTKGIRRLGSAAVDLAYVACGRFDGFYEYSLHPWDVAAGAFLVKAGGGIVTDFKGGENYLFGSEIIAANKNIHQPILSLMLNNGKTTNQ